MHAPVEPHALLPGIESALSSARVAMVVTNGRREIEWVNDAYTKLTGWRLDEIRGRNPRSFLHGPRTSGRAAGLVGGALRRGEAVAACEFLNYRKTGEPYWVGMHIEPVADERGEVTKYIAFEWDITERKRAESAAAATRRRFEAACRVARLAVLHHDLSTGRVHCSASLLEWLALPSGAPDMPFVELNKYVHLGDRREVRRRYVEAVNSGRPLEISFRAALPDGHEKSVRCWGDMTGWDDGHHAAFTLVFQELHGAEERFAPAPPPVA